MEECKMKDVERKVKEEKGRKILELKRGMK